MIECGNLPAVAGSATDGGAAAAGANLTSGWSGRNVEDTLEEIGLRAGRLENLVTLRSNRSVNQNPQGGEREITYSIGWIQCYKSWRCLRPGGQQRQRWP